VHIEVARPVLKKRTPAPQTATGGGERLWLELHFSYGVLLALPTNQLLGDRLDAELWVVDLGSPEEDPKLFDASSWPKI